VTPSFTACLKRRCLDSRFCEPPKPSIGTDTPVFPKGRSGIVPVFEFVGADTAAGKSAPVNKAPIPTAPTVFRKSLRDHDFLFTDIIATSDFSSKIHGNESGGGHKQVNNLVLVPDIFDPGSIKSMTI
jgi:hypothetical protein